jgi:hypothetical protein
MLHGIVVIAAGVVAGGLVLVNLPKILGLLLALVELGLAASVSARFGPAGALVAFVGLPLAGWGVERTLGAYIGIRRENVWAKRPTIGPHPLSLKQRGNRMVLTVTDSATGQSAAMDQRTLDTVLMVLSLSGQPACLRLDPRAAGAQETTALIAKLIQSDETRSLWLAMPPRPEATRGTTQDVPIVSKVPTGT